MDAVANLGQLHRRGNGVEASNDPNQGVIKRKGLPQRNGIAAFYAVLFSFFVLSCCL